MKTQKTWSTVLFSIDEIHIEATLNYLTRAFSLTHGNNDNNVTYKSEGKNAINEMLWAEKRNKCVAEALKYIKKELNL